MSVFARAFFLVVATAAAGAPICAAAPGDVPLDQLLALFAARQHGHVTFTERHELALLTRPLESSGELFYDAPDYLEKRTLTPKAEDLKLEHGILTLERGRHHRSVELRDYPQLLPYLESLRATLAGDRAALERYFHVQLSGNLDGWQLALLPADATLGRTLREVRIAGERDAIRTVEIRETDGDASVLTLGAVVP